ncbi:MAG TPA: right-handed parallel beta-helix repeat-containing protein [Defluviicoccus sp.]|nr:right-handed parallel beta-helix repeat-containing protein [Defluviicoccus sp.]
MTESAAIPVRPGDDIQAIVEAHPAGTTYSLAPGVYRNQAISPKAGDVFEGPSGDEKGSAVLTGAVVLTEFTRRDGWWAATDQTQDGQVHGECDPEHPRAAYPEDVFFDDVPLLHVAAKEDLKPGTFFFDYEADTIYFGDDPHGREVEVSTTRTAFLPTAENVTIRNLTIEKYAIPAQMGAIGDQYPAAGWVIENNEIRYNHGMGVAFASNAIVRNNHIHHNGQSGLGGNGENALIEGNELSYNNYAGFSRDWECGNKLSNQIGTSVIGNYIHHNDCTGLWIDIDNIDMKIERNIIEYNAGNGIQYEISYRGSIIDNVVRYNTDNKKGWLWNSQILIQNSQDIEVRGNTVIVPETGGNAIGLIEQERGSGLFGEYIVKNVLVHDNKVAFTSPFGMVGAGEDSGDRAIFTRERGNVFSDNTYSVPDRDAPHWSWDDQDLSLSTLIHLYGQESGSVFVDTLAY